MSQVKISVVSGSRAEFGQLLPLLLKLQKDNYFDLDFVVTGSHLWSVSGYTLGEVKNYPLKISEDNRWFVIVFLLQQYMVMFYVPVFVQLRIAKVKQTTTNGIDSTYLFRNF